jgi:hypothetical protein
MISCVKVRDEETRGDFFHSGRRSGFVRRWLRLYETGSRGAADAGADDDAP